MNETDIQAIVARVLQKLQGAPVEHPEPEGGVPDITTADLRAQFLVDAPRDREAFLSLKENTPARLATGHAGARYRTTTMLRFAADHAAAQDAVFSDVDDAFLSRMGWKRYTTACATRDEFLTRPDKGRMFTEETIAAIKRDIGAESQVVLYVADGLSSSAVLANAQDILPVVREGLLAHGIRVAEPFFVQYGRVGTMDTLGGALGADVYCVFLGERPGLVTAESMSAYLAYRPSAGMPESRRTVLANIHRGGTPAVEAGAHIVDVIRLMLEKKASGVDLPI